MLQQPAFSSYCFVLLIWAGGAFATQAQSVTQAAGAVALAADTSHQIVLASGKIKSATFWAFPPGNGYALRFPTPATSKHQLTSIRLHFGYFGERTAKGKVQIRIASVAADGRPAADNLLALPVVITEQTLQHLTQPLTLTWPNERITVPVAGFFIVIEGVGEAADEYVISSPRVVLAGAGNSAIGRRSQPNATPRLLSTWSIPQLFSAKLTTVPVELWWHEGEELAWQSSPKAKQVPMLEVSFE